jgi:protein O-mannosyl-transferase
MARRPRKSVPHDRRDERPLDGPKPGSRSIPREPARRVQCAVYSMLLVAVGLAFIQTVNHGFVDIDDQTYVCKNKNVNEGLTADGLIWAFTHCYASNWHPLTWLSHMLDCQVYSLWPGGHHLTNTILHGLTAVLLMRFLHRSTRHFWLSALVAAIFAVHPLRVESVAWVAERKDVLSGLLCMLTLNFYGAYVQKPTSWGRYIAVVAAFALGLLAKPMLVTLPLVLMLLDYWPLGRWNPWPRNQPVAATSSTAPGFPWRLLIEKLPLVGLSAASCIVTWVAQSDAMVSVTRLPPATRLANAAVAAAAYIFQMLVPRGMAAFYPSPLSGYSPLLIVTALGVLILGSCVCVAFGRDRPYLIVGWLWYLGSLVPVLGLVQVGQQARANRYTYLPQIGLYLMLAWGSAAWASSWPSGRRVGSAAWAVVLALFLSAAWWQTSYWQNSEKLWTHALACTSPNALDHYNLALILQQKNRNAEAIDHDRQAIEARGDYAEAYSNLGRLLEEEGLRDEAIDCYRKALARNDRLAEAENNLGNALRQKGDLQGADQHLQKALALRSNYAEARVNLALVRQRQGADGAAAELCRAALDLNPQLAEAHLLLGNVAARRGDLSQAAEHFRRTLEINRRIPEACFNLALISMQRRQSKEALTFWRAGLALQPNDAAALQMTARMLATDPDPAIRNGQVAVDLATRAVQLTRSGNAATLDTLAAAYAETGRFSEALQFAQKALELAQDNAALTSDIRAHIKSYQSGTPLRKPIESTHRPSLR